MSVVQGKRCEGKLKVQTAAYDFASYTHKICSNEKVFLKRYRWCSTAKIIEAVDELAVYIDLANQVNIRKDLLPENLKKNLELRQSYQHKAIELSIRVETLMEIAYRNNRAKENKPQPEEVIVGITEDKFNNWVGQLLDLRSLLRKWKESERG